MLETSNYSVETARSGEEALRKIQWRAPDLMLLDMQMPKMNGLQTIRACRDLVPDQRIVLVTCVAETSNVVQAIRLGALDYMTKPIYKAELGVWSSVVCPPPSPRNKKFLCSISPPRRSRARENNILRLRVAYRQQTIFSARLHGQKEPL